MLYVSILKSIYSEDYITFYVLSVLFLFHIFYTDADYHITINYFLYYIYVHGIKYKHIYTPVILLVSENCIQFILQYYLKFESDSNFPYNKNYIISVYTHLFNYEFILHMLQSYRFRIMIKAPSEYCKLYICI